MPIHLILHTIFLLNKQCLHQVIKSCQGNSFVQLHTGDHPSIHEMTRGNAIFWAVYFSLSFFILCCDVPYIRTIDMVSIVQVAMCRVSEIVDLVWYMSEPLLPKNWPLGVLAHAFIIVCSLFICSPLSGWGLNHMVP